MKLTLLGFMAFLFFLFSGCQQNISNEPADETDDSIVLPSRPNILWVVAEDLGPYIPSFGDSTIVTPTLSRLASEGICYDAVFSPSGVCSPSRAAIITGMYPTHIAANHMRTGPWWGGSELTPEQLENARKNFPPGLELYEAIPPAAVKMFPEYLRKAGYYCTNNAKEDYQFRKTVTAWDESGKEAHWRNRTPGQPFFAVFNFEVCHESRIWAKANDSLWVDENLDVPVPPYLPNTEVALKDIRRMYSNIKEMDYQVGQILQQLEEDGLLDSTIIFWYSDHGGPLPRMKRLCYDSGLRVPMIIRFPGKQAANTRNKQLISFVDLAPTILSLTGIQPPSHLDGQAFLGPYKASQPRKYIHAAADRFDEKSDIIRAVRNHKYKYIKYYKPELPMLLRVNYRDQMPIMQELHRLNEAGQLNEIQRQWFRSTKPEEELFDTEADPHEVHDLATNPDYKAVLEELRAENERWTHSFDDTGLIPETELQAKLWPDGHHPKTSNPVITENNGKIVINCNTEGASIGYKILEGDQEPKSWTVYDTPVELKTDQKLIAIAHRIGYLKSDTVLYQKEPN